MKFWVRKPNSITDRELFDFTHVKKYKKLRERVKSLTGSEEYKFEALEFGETEIEASLEALNSKNRGKPGKRR